MPVSSLHSFSALTPLSPLTPPNATSGLAFHSSTSGNGMDSYSSCSEIGNGSLLSAPHQPANSSGSGGTGSNAVKLALELALLNGSSSNGGSSGHSGHHHSALNGGGNGSDLCLGLSSSNGALNEIGLGGHHGLGAGNNGLTGSLEDLKMRRSQNMTECVPVPSSEHVAEIVGRQGCKIKALRAKTNTYIKTPVRGDEPVFVVTGRKEDVGLAKREILSAADHFSQIRASRKNQINSTLAFGQLVANTPGQTTVQVRVPYRVVGLVVGPKGATIKRIQQSTHTYIVTPSRDKEPVFEVTGLPENVDAARKEIEAHIALRTGNGGDGFMGDLNNGGSGLYDRLNGASSPHNSSSILNNDFLSNKTLHQLLDESHNSRGHPPATSVWSNGTDSHDSGIGHSPPFDALGHNFGEPALNNPSDNNKGTGIWGELNKVLGNLDINGGGGGEGNKNHFLNNVGSRSSLDLGSLGSLGVGITNGSSSSSSTTDHIHHHRPSLDLGVMSSISINNNTARNNDITAESPTADILADQADSSPVGEENGEFHSF